MRVAFLFGAGTSVPSGIPTTNGMIKTIIEREIDWSKKEYKNCGDIIQKILGNTDFDNIEKLMEELEKIIDTPRDWLEKHNYCKDDIKKIEENQKDAESLLKEIKSYISNVCHIRTKLDDGKEALKPIIELGKNHRFKIFTTNYDNNIEDTCEDLGIAYNTGIGMGNDKKTYFSPTFFDDDKLGIYKLHGSIYWYRSKDTPGTLIHFDDPDLSGERIEDAMIYPGRKKELLNYPYSVLFRLFDDAMDNLDKLVVIGHRFEDEHIVEIIERRLGNKNFELIIINPNPDDGEKIKVLDKKRNVRVIPKSIQEWVKDESFSELSNEMDPIPIPPKSTKPPRISRQQLKFGLIISIALVVTFAFLSQLYASNIAENEYEIIKKIIEDDIHTSFEIAVDLENRASDDYNQNYLPNGVSIDDYIRDTLKNRYQGDPLFKNQTVTVVHLDPIHYAILAIQNDQGCEYVLYPYMDKMLENGGSLIAPQEWCPRILGIEDGPIMTDVLHSFGTQDFAVDVGMRFDLNGDGKPDGYHLMGMTREKFCNEIKKHTINHQFVLVDNDNNIIFDTGKCGKPDVYDNNGEFNKNKFVNMSPGQFDKLTYPTIRNMEKTILLSDFTDIHGYDIKEDDISWTLYMYK